MRVVADMDARVKLTLLIAWTVGVFFIDSLVPLAALFIGLCVMIHLTNSNERGGLGVPVTFLVLLVFIFLSSSIVSVENADLFAFGPVGFSRDGVLRGAASVLRIATLFAISDWVCSTTPTAEMVEAFVTLASPLKKLGVAVDDFACMLAIAVRFIPLSSEELDRAVLAQRSRCEAVGVGGLWRRVMAWGRVFVVVVVGLFRRAESLADAMVVRGYGSHERSQQNTVRLRPRDAMVAVVGLVGCVVLAVLF